MIVTTWVPQPLKQRTLKDVPSSLESPVLCWLTNLLLVRLYTVPNPDTTKPPIVRRVGVDGSTQTLAYPPDAYPLYEPQAPQIKTLEDLPRFRIITTPYGSAWAKTSPTEWVRSAKGGPFMDQGTLGPDYGTFTVTEYEVRGELVNLSEHT